MELGPSWSRLTTWLARRDNELTRTKHSWGWCSSYRSQRTWTPLDSVLLPSKIESAIIKIGYNQRVDKLFTYYILCLSASCSVLFRWCLSNDRFGLKTIRCSFVNPKATAYNLFGKSRQMKNFVINKECFRFMLLSIIRLFIFQNFQNIKIFRKIGLKYFH